MTDKVGQLTDYKTIADRLVERFGEDFITSWTDHRGKVYQLSGMGEPAVSAEEICHDWRVVGACMERMVEVGSIPFIGNHSSDTYQCSCRKGWGPNAPVRHSVNESLPLAIILAYLEATDGA